jgi:hypothetical protein
MRVFAVVLMALAAFAQDRSFTPTQGARRVALVIGNNSYSSKPLVSSANDARAVAQALKEVGFATADVHLVTDARQSELRQAVREFVQSVKPGDLALVYYSGYGVEVKGINYLLPVDVPADATETSVEQEAVSAPRLLRDLDEQGARMRVLVLDACRDNPLHAGKSMGGGLAQMEGRGSLVVFAAQARHTAPDTPGQSNSAFTLALLEGLRQPGISLDDAMKGVSRSVARATHERQVPAIYGSLQDDVVLAPTGIAGPAPAPKPLGPQDPATFAARIPNTNIFRITKADFTPAEWNELRLGSLQVKRHIHTEPVFVMIDPNGLSFLEMPPHPGPIVLGEKVTFRILSTISCGSMAKKVSIAMEPTIQIEAVKYMSSRDVNTGIRSLIGSSCHLQMP